MILVDENKCTLCGACVEACPAGALSVGEGRLVIERNLCAECGACLPVCPAGAIYEVEDAPAAAPERVADPASGARVPTASRLSATVARPTPVYPAPSPSPLWVGFLPLAARFVGGLAGWWLDRRRSVMPAGRGEITARWPACRGGVPLAAGPMRPFALRRRWRGGRGR